MAEVAYELERFAPAEPKPRKKANVKVAKQQKESRLARFKQLGRLGRTLVAAAMIMALVWAVLYTQANLTELNSTIAEKEQDLKEEEAMNAYLTFELDNMTSLKNIEERASELGLEKMDNQQISYYKVEDNNGIKVKESPIEKMLENARNGMKNVIDNITP